jgi:beta-glucosidase
MEKPVRHLSSVLVGILTVAIFAVAFILTAAFTSPGLQAQAPALSLRSATSRPISTPLYKDSTQPIEKRVADLLARMTPEEKFWQLFMLPGEEIKEDEQKYKDGVFGFQIRAFVKKDNAGGQMLDYSVSDNAGSLAEKINDVQRSILAQSRLGIPIIAFDEALHGVVRGGAVAFPQAIALAATWDTLMMSKVASAIAGESRIRGIRQILSPVINIAADPRWGRVEETYGEDPLLSSAMGAAFVGAFERAGIITTPKHFIANVGDGGRDSYPIHYDQRLLDQVYFPPFRAAIGAGARSIMSAYNSLNGDPSSADEWLLTKKLKQDWGFKGFVISDANAVGGTNVLLFTSPDYATSAAQSINRGLDVIFQTSYDHYKLFIPPFLDGRIGKKRIDDAVGRVLRAKFGLGLFEHPYVTAADLKIWGDTSGHKLLARKAAQESIVLLKNENHTLPLDARHIHSIAVIGEDATEARLGGYSGPGVNKVSVLDGIRARAGKDIAVSYSPGCTRRPAEWTVVPTEYLRPARDSLSHGLTGAYFNNITLSGAPLVTRLDRAIDFQWTLNSPARGINKDFYSARWTGVFRAPQTGRFRIGLDGDDGYRFYLDDSLIIDNWKKQSYSTRLKEFSFVQGHDYSIRIEFFEPAGNARLRLIWTLGTDSARQQNINQAVTAAGKSDIIIMAAGIHEGEFQDRASLALPGHQEELINRLAATGKPVVVLLVGGSAITMNSWLDKVPAILDLWYPGEEGGNAIASILFGDANPSGRLPISFPVSEAQLPWVYNHEPTGRGDDYNNLTGLPLFPFGFGLSYTSFEYSDIHLDKSSIQRGDSALVLCIVRNTGGVEGDEVVQLYLHEKVASIARPVIELKGFQRLRLRPGESRRVSFTLSPALLQSPDRDLQWTVEPGEYRIMIGASSRDLRLKTNLQIED